MANSIRHENEGCGARLLTLPVLRLGRDLFHKLLLHCGRQRFDWLPGSIACCFFRFLTSGLGAQDFQQAAYALLRSVSCNLIE